WIVALEAIAVDRRKKISIVAIVLFVGTALALEFRRPKTAGDSEASHGSLGSSSVTSSDSALTSAPLWPSSAQHGNSPIESAQATAENGPGPSVDVAARAATLIPQLSSLAPDTSRLVELNGPEQTHIIADGDTLVALAQRYLDDPQRAREIYEFNRDVLKDP